MGYESRLYIVDKKSTGNGKGKRWAEIIAVFNMCKCPLDVFHSYTDCYIYADDGNTQIEEDKYGEPLREASIEEVVKAFEKIIEQGSEYRRLFPTLAALSTFEEQVNTGVWNNLVVLHYGY